MFCVEKEFGGVTILTLKGKLTATGDGEDLHAHIKSILDRQKNKIILNMKNLTRISSQGIGAILHALTEVREAGGDLRLAGLDENIKTIFEITKLIGLIKIYDQTDEAIESFA